MTERKVVVVDGVRGIGGVTDGYGTTHILDIFHDHEGEKMEEGFNREISFKKGEGKEGGGGERGEAMDPFQER
jgi:hypothetical protein